MEAKAYLKYVRISPRKVSIVLDLIRGNNFHMNRESLYVSECFVTPGPTLKRMMPRGKGSADRILKRTSHITLAVKERD